jgi:RHH-type proline utilization regulon transcriptional repressor/proline dehydrogenase/delta 1-pyrroline-5-carboxylate dehydrogenase
MQDVNAALHAAKLGARDWVQVRPERRAALLEAWADALEDGLPHFCALAVFEAGKTWPNAVADVREAIDFCRYYAQLARRLTDEQPLGVVATIAPWNFPLAIFTGQVAAALAAGNAVVAKPAEQTPLMAFEAVRAAHAAGIALSALQLLPGGGDIGAALVADARVDGVMFTGSLQVAKLIERNLHRRATEREVPLVAETSGVNAMIVDSSALVDQAVQDVIASAFDSAGQRCSALRLLWLQDDIADRFIEALRGAMAELRVGDPSLLASDIGPVIDDEALQRLQAHERLLQRDAKLIARVPLPASGAGHFFAPCAYEIASLAPVAQETFGPILHVARYAAHELDAVIARSAALGYALTFGVHSRVRTHIDRVAAHAPGGNIYINRNMIGAVVGSQPFGGGRKSGTGPKAGGPWALHRLLREVREPVARREPQRLPSVTGEHNRWLLEPRGVVACAGPSPQDVQAQLDLCDALGLQAVDALRAPRAYARPDLGAVLRAQWSADFAQQLAAQREDLLPIVTPGSDGGYPAWRLFEERVVSDNITASGGNVELLTR